MTWVMIIRTRQCQVLIFESGLIANRRRYLSVWIFCNLFYYIFSSWEMLRHIGLFGGVEFLKHISLPSELEERFRKRLQQKVSPVKDFLFLSTKTNKEKEVRQKRCYMEKGWRKKRDGHERQKKIEARKERKVERKQKERETYAQKKRDKERERHQEEKETKCENEC